MQALINKILHTLSLFTILLKISSATHTLLPTQPFSTNHSLISQNQVFELRFSTVGESSAAAFLVIRYTATPEVVVWVANRDNPIAASQPPPLLTLYRNGSLIITSGGTVIWSAEPPPPPPAATNPVLQLLDTGNLVLVENSNSTSEGGYLWQSFDYPTDTWLPGMKIVDDMDAGVERYLTSWKSLNDPSPGNFSFRLENRGLPELAVYKGETKIYRSGKWNGVFFSSMPSMPDSVSKFGMVFRQGRLISVTRPYESSIFVRSRLDESGLFRRYNMNSRRDAWTSTYLFPQDRCDEYGYCGPHAVCRIEKVQRCECLKGFEPDSKKDWDLQDWHGGCRRVKALSCNGSEDGFLEVGGLKHPEMSRFRVNTSVSLGECRAECLRNCNCTAYANTNISDGGSGCVMWYGDLVDIRGVLGVDTPQSLYIRLPVSELGDATEEVKKKRGRPKKVRVIAAVTCGVVSAGLIITILLITRRKRLATSREKSEDLELPLFKYATIVAATQDFSATNLVGEGGFGPVYLGSLSGKEEIAVKRLSKTSKQGLKEFKNEVILIAKLQHRNLVKLLGCCIEGDERMLVYEYLQNKSLDKIVFDRSRITLLTWPKRFDIIMGISRGLLYLHQDSRLKIIHRDLKTSNILLDADLNPKISDFGLARIFGEGESIATTTRVVGTYGYMAPEYAVDGKYSVKSDVFALGVIILEIVSGRRNRGFDSLDHHHSLLGHAWLLWRGNQILEMMDECLKMSNNNFIESQVKRCMQVGLLCVQKFAADRPTMPSVVSMLGTEGAFLPKPKEPGFFLERSSSFVASTSREATVLTITELEAR